MAQEVGTIEQLSRWLASEMNESEAHPDQKRFFTLWEVLEKIGEFNSGFDRVELEKQIKQLREEVRKGGSDE